MTPTATLGSGPAIEPVAIAATAANVAADRSSTNAAGTGIAAVESPPLPGVFPVTRSILCADALGAAIEHLYPVGPCLECRLLKPGANDTYLITTDGGKYIARVYRVRWRSPSHIRWELDLLTHLASKDVSVSLPLPSKAGQRMQALPAPEGPRQLVLFSHVEGRPLSWDDEEHCHLAGRAAAQVHSATDDFSSPHERFRLDLDYLIDAPVRAVRPFLVHRPDDLRYLQEFAGRLRSQADVAIAAGLDWGVCHGDFGANNVLLGDRGEVTVLDFDLSGPGWRLLDYAPVYRTSRRNEADGGWQAFVRGYRGQRPLSDATLAAVGLFRILRHLQMLGVFAENKLDWGTTRISDSKLTGWLASFREWEANPEKGPG